MPMKMRCVYLLLLASAVLRAHATCRVKLDVDPAQSTFTLSGDNAVIINGAQIPATIAGPDNITLGFQGSLYATNAFLPECPSTIDAWLAAISNFTFASFSSVYSFQNIELYPPLIPASTAGSPYDLSHMQLNISSVSVSSAGHGSNNISIVWNTSLVEAYLYSNNALTGERFDSLAGYPGATNLVIPTNGVLQLQVAPSNSSVLSLLLQPFNLNLTVQGTIQPDPSGPIFTTLTILRLKGQMLLKAELACHNYCGDFGRCVVVGTVPGCQCECGWTVNDKGSCTQPVGYCSAYADATNSSILVMNTTNATCPTCPSCDGTPSSSVAPVDGKCPTGYDLNAAGVICNACPANFTGTGCASCLTDRACQLSLNTDRATCVKNATYLAHSEVKQYTCNLLDPGIVTLLGSSVSFNCSTIAPPTSASTAQPPPSFSSSMGTLLPPASDPIGHSPYCALTFRLKDMPYSQSVQCTGWSCQFGVDTADVYCSTIVCKCPNGCEADGTDWNQTFPYVHGALHLKCDGSSEANIACSLEFTGLPITSIQTSCNVTECYNPAADVTLSTSNITSSSTRVIDPIISAIPTMWILLGCILCTTAMALNYNYIKPHSPAAAAAAAARPIVTPATAVAEGLEPNGLATALNQGISSLSTVQMSPNKAAHGHNHTSLGLDGVRDVSSTSKGSLEVDLSAALGGLLHGGSSTAVLAPGCSLMEMAVLNTPLTPPGPVKELCFEGVSVFIQDSWWGRLPHRTLRCPSSVASGRPKQILHHVSGNLAAGQVVGLLGPSGSGKTTLLNVLAGQVQSGGRWKVSGLVLLDGRLVAPGRMSRVTAHVPQHDLLLRSLSVEECLTYSAVMRLDVSTTPAQVAALVDQVLQELGIAHIRHRQGFLGSNAQISGGERQRVSIGMELVTNPRILLLDEPTSGLDSFTARQLLQMLKAVALPGRIVISSLHQPSPVLFNLLDKVLLLSQGHLVFSGHPSSATAAFESYGLPCPAHVSIAEHMLELVANPSTTHKLLAAVRAEAGAELVAAAAAADAAAAALPGEQQLQQLPPMPKFNTLGRRAWRKHVVREFGMLFWRSLADVLRNPFLLLMHLCMAACMGLLVGFVYYQTPTDTAGAQNRVGAIFFAMNLLAFPSITAIDLLLCERQVVDRELSRHYYGATAYMLSKLLLDALLLRLVPCVVFGTLFYWLMGLRSSVAAFTTFLFIFCTFVCIVAEVALIAACLLSSAGKSMLMTLFVLLAAVLFSGFLANKGSIPWALRWLCYLSPFRWAWEGLVINELRPIFINLSPIDGTPVPGLKGEVFLEILGVDPTVLTVDVVVLIGMYIGLFFAAIAAMHIRLAVIRHGWTS